jgi:hypothetical protein
LARPVMASCGAADLRRNASRSASGVVGILRFVMRAGIAVAEYTEPRGCAIVETGPDVWCEGGNARIEVRWRVLPDASCVRTVCRDSLFPSIDCPGLP